MEPPYPISIPDSLAATIYGNVYSSYDSNSSLFLATWQDDFSKKPFYATFNPATGQWSMPAPIPNSLPAFLDFDIFASFDSNSGLFLVTWQDAPTNLPFYATYEPSNLTWSIPTSIPNSPFVSNSVYSAYDSNSAFFLVTWINPAFSDPTYATYDAKTQKWSTPAFISTVRGINDVIPSFDPNSNLFLAIWPFYPSPQNPALYSTFLATTLTLSKSHAGNFAVGQTDSYTLTVGNKGSAPTKGLITVTDSLPEGVTFISGSGIGWEITASGQTITATTNNIIPPGQNAPPIALVVNVAAPARIVNNLAIATGGDSPTSATAVDLTIITTPSITLSKAHHGNFFVGKTVQDIIARLGCCKFESFELMKSALGNFSQPLRAYRNCQEKDMGKDVCPCPIYG